MKNFKELSPFKQNLVAWAIVLGKCIGVLLVVCLVVYAGFLIGDLHEYLVQGNYYMLTFQYLLFGLIFLFLLFALYMFVSFFIDLKNEQLRKMRETN